MRALFFLPLLASPTLVFASSEIPHGGPILQSIIAITFMSVMLLGVLVLHYYIEYTSIKRESPDSIHNDDNAHDNKDETRDSNKDNPNPI